MKHFFILIAVFGLILSESAQAVPNQRQTRNKSLKRSLSKKIKKKRVSAQKKQSDLVPAVSKKAKTEKGKKRDNLPEVSVSEIPEPESKNPEVQENQTFFEKTKQFWNTHKSTIIGNGLAAAGLFAGYKYLPKTGLLLAAGGGAAKATSHADHDPTIIEMKPFKESNTGNKEFDTPYNTLITMNNHIISDFVNHPIRETALMMIPFAGGTRLAHFAGKTLLHKGWKRAGSATIKSRFWAPLLATIPLMPPATFAWDNTFGDMPDKYISRASRTKLHSCEDGCKNFME